MNMIAFVSTPVVPEIVQDLLVIMRHKTGAKGEGWNGATTMEQAGIDSLELTELILDAEDKYRIKVNFKRTRSYQELATVEDLARLVQATMRKDGIAK